MSRLGTMSPQALKAFYSPDGDEQVIILLTLSGAGIASPIYLADGWTQRLSENDDDVVYGVISRGTPYIFLPLEIKLPSDEDGAAANAQVVIHNVTRQLTPALRQLTSPPNVTIEVILASNPNSVEVSFTGFKLNGFTYNSETVSGSLIVDQNTGEPFPRHSFTPNNFPALF